MTRRGLIAVLLVVLGPAGCDRNAAETPDSTAITDRIQADLSGRPEVIYAEVV
ncbi:MAG TPA: hypothetical protein VN408_27880 [Actinoplanes sp.]|nr:hypothetical protein [Actinoplanes sp.]